MRIRALAGTQLALYVPLALHLQNHHVHGAPADYVGVILASAASWFGLPGPGEAVLVTAAILAAHNHLNIGPVLFYAWLGATAGGVGGWALGRRAGRAVVTAPGPLLKTRLRALERSERLYERYGTLAVFFTPSWGAGIAHMRPRAFLVANTVSAALWAIGFGLSGYLAGRTLTDLLSDIGLVAAIVVGCAIVGAVVFGATRRSRRAGERRSSSS
jgi:undecaprenyl-diphosphatase